MKDPNNKKEANLNKEGKIVNALPDPEEKNERKPDDVEPDERFEEEFDNVTEDEESELNKDGENKFF